MGHFLPLLLKSVPWCFCTKRGFLYKNNSSKRSTLKYWQITTSRLSRAAQKLTMDDAWHEFESMPHAWYRVWRKRLVQRVNFRDSDEEMQLLPMIRTIEPLESMGRTGGFREEMEIRMMDDRFAVVVPLGYIPKAPSRLERLLSSSNMTLSTDGNLASVVIAFDVLDHDSLTEARERLALARQLYDENK